MNSPWRPQDIGDSITHHATRPEPDHRTMDGADMDEFVENYEVAYLINWVNDRGDQPVLWRMRLWSLPE